MYVFFFFKQKTAYEMRISDWSSDVCSSDLIPDPSRLDIALVGVPWDGGTTNRAGARHGPREIRNMSSFMRKVHHVSRIAPYELARVADVGDAPVNPIDLMDSLRRIEGFFTTQIGRATRLNSSH